MVAGVIYGDKNHYPNQILISRRPDYLHQGGLWEFPGGKIEHNEAPQQGLTRELEEELSIRVTHAEPLMKIVRLMTGEISQFSLFLIITKRCRGHLNPLKTTFKFRQASTTQLLFM